MVALAVSQSIATLEWLNSGHFSPATLFATSEPGVWYDPSDVANTNWRYNLLTWTEQFDNAAWIKDGATVSANSSVAPNGTTTADTLIETATTGFHSVYQLLSTSLPAGNFSFSIYVKASGRSKFRLQQNSVVAYSVLFDIVALTATTVAGGASGTISDAGNGWYRCTMNYTTTSDFAPLVILYLGNDAGTISYAGNGTSGVLIWGAQLEANNTATTYQPITTVDAETIARFPQATLYQDSIGTIPVTAPAQPVGLMLDKKNGLVLGSEIVTNGDFSQGSTGWTDITGAWSVSGGALVGTSVGSSAFGPYSNNTGVVAGRTYQATFTITVTSGSLLTRVGNTESSGYTSSGTFSRLFVATTTGVTAFQVRAGASGFTGTIDNISVRELPGTHATQSTSASRPTYGIVPATGRRNLLTFSEQFDNAAWGKTNATITANTTTAPNGTNTADKLVENTAVSVQHFFSQTPATTLNTAYALSVYAKASERSRIQLFAFGSATTLSTFDLSNGTVVGGPGVIQSVGDGWYRCTMPFLGATTSTLLGVFLVSSGTTTTYTGDGTSGVFFWGAQLETGSTATAYQRVVTAFEVTEANVASLSYLSFDGIDDFMVTPTIDPSVGVTPGPELVTNGTFAVNVNGWTFEPTATNTSSPGFLSGTTGPSTNLLAHQIVTTVVGRTYTCVILTGGASTAVYVSPSTPGGLTLGSTGFATNGTRTLTFVATSTTTYLSVMSVGAASNAVLDNISVRDIVADKVQVFAGVRKLSDVGNGTLVELSTAADANNGAFYIRAPAFTQPNYSWYSRGTLGADSYASPFASPITNVIAATSDISGDITVFRANGTQATQSTADQGTGNYLAYPMFIGRRGGTTLPFNGQMYGLITRFGSNLNTSQLVSTEGWMNTKTRAY